MDDSDGQLSAGTVHMRDMSKAPSASLQAALQRNWDSFVPVEALILRHAAGYIHSNLDVS